MLRLPKWRLPSRHRDVGGYCVLVFPHSAEYRWLDQIPTPGARIRDCEGDECWGRVWVVDTVLQSGRNAYTVFCVGRDQYLDKLRNPRGFLPDLDVELLELARNTRETVSERRRRRRYRYHLP
jgi:hypothetical protein